MRVIVAIKRCLWAGMQGLFAAVPAWACTDPALFADGFETAGRSVVPCVIDAGASAAGSRALLLADLDLDGGTDLLAAQAYNQDRLVLYRGLGQGRFAPQQVLDAGSDDPIAVAVGDFDADERPDIVSLTATEGAVRLYRGQPQAAFAAAITVGSPRLLGTGLVAGNFDDVAGDDLVVIGQHSIDFLRSAGAAGLVQEVILDTASAPDILECMALDAADVDADGDLDVLVAESRGGVWYRNDGAGHFSPQVFTAQRRIVRAIHALDADGDAWPDAVVQVSSGELMLYRNVGNGPSGAGELLFTTSAVALGSMASVDLDGDGWQDLQLAFGQTLKSSRNLQGAGFAAPGVLHADAALFIDEVAQGDVDHDGHADLLWSAANGHIAYIRATIANSLRR